MNGQDKKKKNQSKSWIAGYERDDSLATVARDSAFLAQQDSLNAGGNKNVDTILKSLYGPVSEYVRPDSLYQDYSRVYEAGINQKERNLSGYDPMDFAKKQGFGDSQMRQYALRGGRDVQYAQSQGSAYSMYPIMPIQTGYGDPFIPGYDLWKSQNINPNNMEDYFYDLAFQDILSSQVRTGRKAQGKTFWSAGNLSNTQNNMRQLKQLVGEENLQEHLDNISRQAISKARQWVTDYRTTTKAGMKSAIDVVQGRQDKLASDDILIDLNDVIRKKEALENTKASLGKIDSTNTTGATQKIIEEQTSKVDNLETQILYNIDESGRMTRIIDDSLSHITNASTPIKKKDKKKKEPWLPEGVKDTGLKNYSGNRIRMHEDLIPIYMEALDTLKKEGIDLQIEDSFRYRDVQNTQYIDSFGTVKEGLVAHPDSSYHVRGKAFDLAQTDEMRYNPRVAEVLDSLGLIQSRPDDEWWHWSTPN